MGPSNASLPTRKAIHPCKAAKPRRSIYSANGIRTRVWALRGPRPSPLDDSAATTRIVLPELDCELLSQARRESNPQPPVLETGALPIELRTYSRTATAASCE